MKPKKLLSWLIRVLSVWPFLTFAVSAKMTDIQVFPNTNMTRIIFTLTDAVKPRIFSLAHPYRLVMDFPNTRLLAKPLSGMRSGYSKSAVLRLVWDMGEAVKFKDNSLPPYKKIILDIFHPTLPQTVSVTGHPLSLPAPHTMKIVIDPGHGGKDPGAMGKYHTAEKDIVLAIAKQTEQLINQQPHIHAVLTRPHDRFVSLRERLKLARQDKADLFISIHADSFLNDDSHGASVYALSRYGATSEAARWLAGRENYSELGGVDLGELKDQSYLLRSVLIDLAQTATITDSLQLGSTVLNALDKVTKLHYRRVEQAPFVVLKSPDIPSILVEVGFISNTGEEMRLKDPIYQQKLAKALLNGIQRYIKKYRIG